MCSAEEIAKLNSQVKVARDEIKNLRKSVDTLKRVNEKENENIFRLLSQHQRRYQLPQNTEGKIIHPHESPVGQTTENDSLLPIVDMTVVGVVSSDFTEKNGTPRQPLVAESKGTLTISKRAFNNPAHSLQGLEKYSHLWIIFLFHKNSQTSSSSSSSVSSSSSSSFSKAKVHPPRLGGASLGVFACRSPHRPNPIGLTLAKIEKIRDDVIELSSIDLIDGTPVLDLKPYIPDYDEPLRKSPRLTNDDDSTGSSNSFEEEMKKEKVEVKTAEWLEIANEDEGKFRVFFTPTATRGLKAAFDRIHSDFGRMEEDEVEREKPKSFSELKDLVENILREDPRSVYRKNKCREMLYFFQVRGIHVTSWFDDDARVVNVLKVV